MDKTFTISVSMNERWVDHFCSMLKWMEHCGNIGHSSVTAFYADGDGDFRPKFEIETDFNKIDGFRDKEKLPVPEVIFDAG